MTLQITKANLANPRDANDMLEVLDSYAADPVGGGRPLAQEVRDRLPSMLHEHPNALVFLARAGVRPVGVTTCFLTVSTFRAMPLLNIHDLAVVPDSRGQGIGRRLLQAAEDHARGKGCCKLTLEVQQDNTPARTLYQRFGFTDFIIAGSAPTQFLAKNLE